MAAGINEVEIRMLGILITATIMFSIIMGSVGLADQQSLEGPDLNESLEVTIISGNSSIFPDFSIGPPSFIETQSQYAVWAFNVPIDYISTWTDVAGEIDAPFGLPFILYIPPLLFAFLLFAVVIKVLPWVG